MYIDGQCIKGYVSDNLSVNFILHGSAFAWLGFFCSKSSCFLYFFKKQVGKSISYLKNVCNNIFLCKNSCYVIHRTVIRVFVSVQSCIRGHLTMIFKEVGRGTWCKNGFCPIFSSNPCMNSIHWDSEATVQRCS